jgi:hypothetical protein
MINVNAMHFDFQAISNDVYFGSIIQSLTNLGMHYHTKFENSRLNTTDTGTFVRD